MSERDADRLVPPDEALDFILRQIQPLAVEQVGLADAAGRILASPLIADRDLPPFPASTMDGFAVVAGDESTWREVIGEQFAGTMEDIEVTFGTAAKITTGAPLPKGADAVVPVEQTEPAEDHVIIQRDDVRPGENVRPVGSDLRNGDILLQPGIEIGAAEVGLLASLGHSLIGVYRRPRVSILSTGDELVEPDQEPGPGQIRDSNRFSLAVAAQRLGAEVVWLGHGADDREALGALLKERLAESDLLITSGGVSVGERDYVTSLLADLSDVHLRRVFMKPGKPLHFATAGPVAIFGLPGNPVSSIVGFEIFVAAAIRAMAGRADARPMLVPVTLEHDILPGDRIELQRGIVRAAADGRLTARNTGSQASARIASLIGA
ncbi:MAG TPA: gephyrin-like molybdotransferase Glp, partial [Thermomicrobiaceae bacterium]|nr:gephyrin-like molybdotransferase Glp [Thermomicrobiaceae bacterium]